MAVVYLVTHSPRLVVNLAECWIQVIILIIMFYQLGDSFLQNLFAYNDQYSATV